jgi:hypothetical protein
MSYRDCSNQQAFLDGAYWAKNAIMQPSSCFAENTEMVAAAA